MTDVFISYAREDEATVGELVASLRATGFSVWWDQDIPSGANWHDAIEEALERAAAVVAVWSPSSVKSGPVRNEATVARDADKLIPIQIEPCRPPLMVQDIQFEDFLGWGGGGEEKPFQNLAIQIAALARGADEADALPSDGVTRPMVTREDEAAQTPMLERPVGWFKSGSSLISLVIAAAGLLGLTVYREALLGPYWETIVGLAMSALGLFFAAENALTEHRKAIIRRSLFARRGERPYNAATAFTELVEAVYTARHWSGACLLRSALTTVLLYGALLLAWVPIDILSESISRLLSEPLDVPTPGDWQDYGQRVIETNPALLFLAIPLANIVIDYFSLWQTRTVLRFSQGGLPLALGVALDAALTAILFVAAAPLGPVLLVLILGGFGGEAVQTAWLIAGETWSQLFSLFDHGWRGELDSALSGEASLATTSLLIAFVTTFVTSAWLWAALIASLIARLFLWSRRRGLTFLGKLVNVRKQPISALGYLSAGAILLVAIMTSTMARAIDAVFAAPGTLSVAARGETLRDCEGCPEMAAIPGGPLMMGSNKGDPDEKPPHLRVVPQFWIGRTEVTFRQWEGCVAAGFCRSIDRGGDAKNGDQGWGRGVRPVITVSHEDTLRFIAWLNQIDGRQLEYRLPSEAEWEYAARGGSTAGYAFGDLITTDQANFDGSAAPGGVNRARTLTVAAFKPNAFGLYDMHGNVYEWVADCFSPTAYQPQPKDAAPVLAAAGQSCALQGMRGGAVDSEAVHLRSANRAAAPPTVTSSTIGFRVAADLRQP